MTLHCGDCGGVVVVTAVSSGPKFAVETYECVTCGGSATNTNGPNGGQPSGVVER